jgi:hypothetical protein
MLDSLDYEHQLTVRKAPNATRKNRLHIISLSFYFPKHREIVRWFITSEITSPNTVGRSEPAVTEQSDFNCLPRY